MLLVAALAAACSSVIVVVRHGQAPVPPAGAAAPRPARAGPPSRSAQNPSGVYSTLAPELKKIYSSYPDNLIASPWATTKITAKPPWKIGYIAFAITNPYNQHVLTG